MIILSFESFVQTSGRIKDPDDQVYSSACMQGTNNVPCSKVTQSFTIIVYFVHGVLSFMLKTVYFQGTLPTFQRNIPMKSCGRRTFSCRNGFHRTTCLVTITRCFLSDTAEQTACTRLVTAIMDV
jgi:hypothetical protein